MDSNTDIYLCQAPTYSQNKAKPPQNARPETLSVLPSITHLPVMFALVALTDGPFKTYFPKTHIYYSTDTQFVRECFYFSEQLGHF